MDKLDFRQINNNICRLKCSRYLKNQFLTICLLYLFIKYISQKYFNSTELSSSIRTRYHPDIPITFDLHSYPICHPNEYHIANLTKQYHQFYSDNNQQPCFLIENLDGGPWWSYVSQEFAEILTHLKQLGIQSNITYQPLLNHDDIYQRTNLTKYFLNICNIDDKLSRDKQNPIILLLWDINRPLWYRIRYQWHSLLVSTRTRLLVFIDDLHYSTKTEYSRRQYVFEHVASEIFSTYPYLFHNYYPNIPSKLLTWLPHSASVLSPHSINQSAENILFVSGANLPEWYPCRARAFSLCQNRNDLVTCLQHPGYGETMKNDSSFYFGAQRYSIYMKQYRFGLGTCQSVQYAIGKLFEIPANGLVLVTTNDLIPILTKLHLYLNQHYLTVDCSSDEKLVNEIIRIKNISNNDLYKIRKQGQNTVYERHLTKHRSELLHTRLLSHALSLSSKSTEQQRMQWGRWARNCYD